MPDIDQNIWVPYQDEDVLVFGLHTDDLDQLLDFVEQTGITFPLVRDIGTRQLLGFPPGVGYPPPGRDHREGWRRTLDQEQLRRDRGDDADPGAARRVAVIFSAPLPPGLTGNGPNKAELDHIDPGVGSNSPSVAIGPFSAGAGTSSQASVRAT